MMRPLTHHWTLVSRNNVYSFTVILIFLAVLEFPETVISQTNTSEVAIRIVPMSNSSNLTGVPEVLWEGKWKTICTHGIWQWPEARVACIEAGFEGGWLARNDQFGSGMKPYFPGLRCTGVDRLADCWYQNSWTCHPNWGAAGVQCFKTGSAFVFYRGWHYSSYYTLQPDTGEMQVLPGYIGLRWFNDDKNKTEWLYVMDGGWDDPDATVVCREHGYPYGKAFSGSPFWSWRVNVYNYIQNVECLGTETKLADCNYTLKNTYLSATWSKWSSAGVICHHQPVLPGYGGLRIRNANGAFLNGFGWVEIRYNAIWGTICDSDWTDDDAAAVCRSQGYTHGKAVKPIYGTRVLYNARILPAWLQNVVCLPNATDFLNCTYEGWGENIKCDTYTQSVGVLCYNAIPSGDFTITLEPWGVNSYTVLVVNYDGLRGSAADFNFTKQDATVACRETNASYVVGYPLYTDEIRGTSTYPWTRPVILTNPVCNGTEAKLKDCEHDQIISTGPWQHSVGALCLTEDNPDVTIGLISHPSSPGIGGPLTVTFNGVTGLICSLPKFGVKEALVGCKQLGFKYGLPNSYTENIKRLGLPFWMQDVRCQGDEAAIWNCSYKGWGNFADVKCVTDHHDAGVYCYEDHAAVRLINGRKSSGQVEVIIDGQSGSISKYGFDNGAEGRLLCAMFGYSSYINHHNAFYRPTSGRIWLTHLACNFNKHDDFFDCPHYGWGQNTGSYIHDWDPGLTCLNYNYDGEHFINSSFDTVACYGFHTSRNTYSANRNDVIVLRTSSHHRLALYFSDFDVQDSANCSADYLEIRDGENATSPLIGRYCGRFLTSMQMPIIRSTATAMYLRWNSNGDSDTGRGWMAVVEKECVGKTLWRNETVTGPVGRFLKKIQNVSVSECQRHCNNDTYCLSAYYEIINSTCYLNMTAYMDARVTNLTHLTMLHLYQDCHLCSGSSWVETPNMFQNGSLLTSLVTINAEECQEECRKRGSCEYLDYSADNGTCNLRYHSNCDNPGFVTDFGVNHFRFVCQDYYCSHMNTSCDHFCLSHPFGGECHCCAGYTLQADGKSCRRKKPLIVAYTKQASARITDGTWVPVAADPKITRRACAQFCTSDLNCQSFNYNNVVETDKCELSNYTINSNSVGNYALSGSEWNLYIIADDLRSEMDICWDSYPDSCRHANSAYLSAYLSEKVHVKLTNLN